MHKRIDAALHVEHRVSRYGIHYSGCATGGRNLAGVEYTEGEGVVGLIARAITHGNAGRHTYLSRSFRADVALYGKRRYAGGEFILIQAHSFEQLVRNALLLMIPHHALGEPTYGGGALSGKPISDIIAGEESGGGAVIDFGLMVFHPCEFGGRKIAGEIQQMLQAPFVAEFISSLLAIANGTRVAPNNRFAKRFALHIQAHEAVHLITDTDSFDRCRSFRMTREQLTSGKLQIIVPHLGRLLRKTRFRR